MPTKQDRGVGRILFGIAALPCAIAGAGYFLNPDEKTDHATTMEQVCRKEPGPKITVVRSSPEALRLDERRRKLLEEIERSRPLIIYDRCPS